MDDKFDKLMDSLKDQNPKKHQVESWKKSVHKNLIPRNPSRYSPIIYWGQLTAAVFVGILIGGLLFGQTKDYSQEKQINDYDDATIEVIYTNL